MVLREVIGTMLLPTPLAWIKKVLSILKSNLSPTQIAGAVALGVFAGLPPMGLHVLIPLSLALLVRCSFRAFLISMGAFELLSLALSPVSYAVGVWMLDANRGLDGVWRRLFHLPVLAPMGYSRYLLFGSIVLSLIAAIPVFFLVRWLVRRYRTSFATWVSKWRVSQRLKEVRGARLVRKLFAGGDARYGTGTGPKGVFRVIRREMLIVLPALYALAYLLAAVIVPFFAGTLATTTASWAVGADVSVSDSSFNLFTGGLVLSDLAVQDPKAPDENLIVVPEITVDAGMLALVSKRVVFNRVSISDATLHVVRERDGTLNLDNATAGWDADRYLTWAADHADQVDWMGILRNLLDALKTWEPSPPAPSDGAYAGGRSFPAFRAPFEVQQLEIGRLLITLDSERADDAGPLPPVTLLEVEVTNLAFPASLRTEPIRLSLHGQWGDDPESGFLLAATFGESDAGSVCVYEFALRRMDLAGLSAFYASTLPVRIDSGVASISGELRQEGGVSTGMLSFLLEDLHIAETDGALFGLPAETSARVIEGLNRYAQEAPIVFGTAVEGSAEAPRLAWEAPLLEIAQQGLMLAGRRELEETIESLGLHIEELGCGSEVALDPAFSDVRTEAEAAVRSSLESAAEGWLEDLFDDLGSPERTDTPLDEEPADDEGEASAGFFNLLEHLLDSSSSEEGSEANP